MRYHSQLIEATLLKRPVSFLMEVVLPSKRRIMLRCPNLGPLTGCDILGTQLWFSAPTGDNYLPTLELVEVNGGFLVGINQEILKNLAIEAIQQGSIKGLASYKFIDKVTPYEQHEQNAILTFNLAKNITEQCYICLEHVIYVNEQYEAVFPINNKFTSTNLDYLTLRKKQGNRAILLYCILNSGAKTLKFAEEANNFYPKLISKAVANGIELLAYKASISTQEIKLNQAIAIKFPMILAQ